jgi:hypothetical protein
MRLRSRGLGKRELVMDFREYALVRKDDEVVVVGTIRDPVSWEFSIRVCEDDLPGLTRLLLNRTMIGLLLRALFKRRKSHHWSQDHAEHLAEGARRRVGAIEKAAELATASFDAAGERRVPRRDVSRGAAAPSS